MVLTKTHRVADHETPYKRAFARLMQAIEQGDEPETDRQSITCIGIAMEGVDSNPYWLSQLIVLYTTLANIQAAQGNFRRAISLATLGVETAELSRDLIGEEYIQGVLIAQAVLLRASIYAAENQWERAVNDLSRAGDIYESAMDATGRTQGRLAAGGSQQLSAIQTSLLARH